MEETIIGYNTHDHYYARGTATQLSTLNPVVPPSVTFIEIGTGRKKTLFSTMTKEEWDVLPDVERFRWNDLPYDDRVLVFTTEAEVRAFTTPYRDGQIIYIISRAGTYYYDSTDTTTADNIGIVLVDAVGRRLRRQYDKSIGVCVDWFDNDEVDDGIFIQKAIDAAAEEGVSTGSYIENDYNGPLYVRVDPVSTTSVKVRYINPTANSVTPTAFRALATRVI